MLHHQHKVAMFLCRSRKPNWIISFQTNLNLLRGLPKLWTTWGKFLCVFAGHSVTVWAKRGSVTHTTNRHLNPSQQQFCLNFSCVMPWPLLYSCRPDPALRCVWITGPWKQRTGQRGGGSAATGEWYSTAVLYRFSTAIIKSVRHSTSYFLPTFPLIQTWLSHCAFWPKRCTSGSYFHSIRHTVSLYFLLSGDFFTVLSKPTVPSQRYFLPLKYQQSVPFWLETIQSDCTPLTLCHTHWTEQIPFFLPFY